VNLKRLLICSLAVVVVVGVLIFETLPPARGQGLYQEPGYKDFYMACSSWTSASSVTRCTLAAPSGYTIEEVRVMPLAIADQSITLGFWDAATDDDSAFAAHPTVDSMLVRTYHNAAVGDSSYSIALDMEVFGLDPWTYEGEWNYITITGVGDGEAWEVCAKSGKENWVATGR